MMILRSLRSGTASVWRTKRFVLFAWAVNVAFALMLALPLLNQLDRYIGPTEHEEELLKRMDPGWYETYRLDFEKSELAGLFDYTVFGYAPFVNHLELTLSGVFVRALGRFLVDLVFHFDLNPEHLPLHFGLGVLYLLVSTFLAGAFLGTYARAYPLTFTEFLMEGAKYFGRFFRLSLVALVVFCALFEILGEIQSGISVWTRSSASEAVPFTLYMIKGAAALFLVGFAGMILDYARIRIVAEERSSALAASVAGVAFVVRHIWNAFGLYTLLALAGVTIITLYAALESAVQQDSYWPIVLVFVLQQIYMIARFGLKATFYAGQTHLYRELRAQEQAAVVSAPVGATQ